MKSLKSILSLGLTTSLLCSCLAHPTFAAELSRSKTFLDQDQIQNTQAVSIITTIGVMVGDTNGYFNPTSSVTRAEMAVICTKLLYGDNFTPSLFADETIFNDVPSWATPYINLASMKGIVAGYGDGSFRPDQAVTPTEAMLMLLKTLGYFQKTGELGKDWSATSFYKAQEVGLYQPQKDGVLDVNLPLTRENVAVLAFRAITEVTMVEYNAATDSYFPSGGLMFEHSGT